MGFLNKERKGMHCSENEDNSVTCKRVRQTKDGQMVTDGQEITFSADPDNGCQTRITGDSTFLDEELGDFEKVGKKVAAGCHKRQIKKGYS